MLLRLIVKGLSATAEGVRPKSADRIASRSNRNNFPENSDFAGEVLYGSQTQAIFPRPLQGEKP
jgi:hypothetical protein